FPESCLRVPTRFRPPWAGQFVRQTTVSELTSPDSDGLDAHALASLQSVHHLLDTRLLGLFPLGFTDSSQPFFLVRERQGFPSLLCGLVGCNHLLDLGGDFDHTFIAIALQDYFDEVASFAFSAFAHLLIHDHHVSTPHVAERAAKRITIYGPADWHSSLRAKHRWDIERRTQSRRVHAIHAL